MQQHAKGGLTGATRRDALRHELVAEVRWEECASEDAAAAREADLIVAFQPLLNASHATDGRWVYIAADADAGRRTSRFRLSPTIGGAAGRVYGCFPHIGRGVELAAGHRLQ